MTYSFVQYNRNRVFSGTTVTVSPTNPFTAGNAILIGIDFQPNTLSVASIADGVNAYVIGPQTASGAGVQDGYAYALNIAAGTPTITFTVTGGTFTLGAIFIEEWSGIAAADGSNGNIAFTAGSGSSGQSFNSGSFTTTVNGDLIWGWGHTLQGTAIDPGSGFTANVIDGPTGYYSEFQVQSAAGPINASFTTATNGAFGLFATGVAFEPPPVSVPPLGVASCEW